MTSMPDDGAERPVAFLDTSVLLGYLLDEADRAERCLALLQKAEAGEVRLRTSALVIAEIVWTLSASRYQLSQEEIRDRLLPVLGMRGLAIDDKHLYPRVLDLFATHNIDFTDAFNAALMEKEGVADIYSFDHHYDRLSFLKRLEPQT